MISTERRSESVPLLLNSCGVNRTGSERCGSLRPLGRADYHLLYIAKGECHVVLREGEQIAPEGSLVIYLPGQRQEYYFEGGSGSVSYYIHFTGRDAKSYLHSLGLLGQMVLPGLSNPEISRLFSLLHAEYALAQKSHETVTAGLLLAFLGIASRGVELAAVQIDEKKQALVQHAIETMHEGLGSRLSVAELAARCNYSVGYFSHLFRTVTGISVHAYMARLRIERAKELLESASLSILEISLAVGYEDQNYFSRFFKEHTGVSPSAYREALNGRIFDEARLW